MKFTLDTNCLIDLEQDTPRAAAIKELLALVRTPMVDVAVVAISASEQQRDREFMESFSEFQSWLATIGIGGAEILMPLDYVGLTYVEWALVGDDEGVMEGEVKALHHAVFPGLPYDHPGEGATPVVRRKWRNRRCDALALWSHIHHRRDVFVTSDAKLIKRARILTGLSVCNPKDACVAAAKA